MAALSPLSQSFSDGKDGRFICTTKVRIASSSDTVVLPEGLNNAAHVAVIPLDASDTAATVSSISQADHPAGVTVTLTSGTLGSDQLVLSMHIGNPAGL